MSRKKSTTPTGGLRYIGRPLSILNVPARNLSAEEAERYWPVIQQQQQLVGQTIYEPIEDRAAEDISTMIATPEGDTAMIDTSAEADKED